MIEDRILVVPHQSHVHEDMVRVHRQPRNGGREASSSRIVPTSAHNPGLIVVVPVQRIPPLPSTPPGTVRAWTQLPLARLFAREHQPSPDVGQGGTTELGCAAFHPDVNGLTEAERPRHVMKKSSDVNPDIEPPAGERRRRRPSVDDAQTRNQSASAEPGRPRLEAECPRYVTGKLYRFLAVTLEFVVQLWINADRRVDPQDCRARNIHRRLMKTPAPLLVTREYGDTLNEHFNIRSHNRSPKISVHHV